MIDIIDRLRGPASSILAMRDAADEIERLRRMLAASQWRSIESISLPPIAPDGDDPTVAYSVSHNVIFFDPDIGLVLEGFAEDRVDISADNWIRAH